MMKNYQVLGGDFNAFPEEVFLKAFSSPVVTGENTMYNNWTRMFSGAGATNGGQSAAYQPARGGQLGPESVFDPADVAKVYRPQAWKEHQALLKEASGNPDAPPTPSWPEYFKSYMEELKMYGATPTIDPNAPPPPGAGGQGGGGGVGAGAVAIPAREDPDINPDAAFGAPPAGYKWEYFDPPGQWGPLPLTAMDLLGQRAQQDPLYQLVQSFPGRGAAGAARNREPAALDAQMAKLHALLGR